MLDRKLGRGQLGTGDREGGFEPGRQRHAGLGVHGREIGALVGELLLGIVERLARGVHGVVRALAVTLGLQGVVEGLAGAEQDALGVGHRVLGVAPIDR